jgi:hypothetical protein
MDKAQIIAQLPSLNPQDLADVRAKLEELTPSTAAAGPSGGATTVPSRVVTPRLADRRQAKDFRKQVTELRPDATL